jgi:hypothetical protein
VTIGVPGREELTILDAETGEVACRLTIDRVELHDAAGGTLQLGGIGNVATPEAYRRRGLASQLVTRAIEQLRSAALDGSLLYGIDDFYVPFGWRSCGDERWIRVPLDRAIVPPDGIVVRFATGGDVERVVALHARMVPHQRGAITRPADGRVWSRLTVPELRVAERGGELVGWAWRGRGEVAERDSVAARELDCGVWAELQAVDVDAAHALLEAVVDESRADSGCSAVLLGAPHDHPLRGLAGTRAISCALIDEVRPSGGAMLLPFTDAARLVGDELYQALPDRF